MNLTNTANEIREHHAHARRAFAETMEHALEAGRLLALAKVGMAHGSFGAWVEQHCGFSDRNARRYMQLHAHREQLPDGAGVRWALEHLREPRILSAADSMKTDTVSEMESDCTVAPAWLPEEGFAAQCSNGRGRTWYAWRVPADRLGSDDAPIYAYALSTAEDDKGGLSVDYTSRGIRFDYLEQTLQGFGLPSMRVYAWATTGSAEPQAIQDEMRKLDHKDWARAA